MQDLESEPSHDTRPRIVFAVTASLQIPFLGRMPEYFAANGWDVHVISSPGVEHAELTRNPGRLTIHSIPMVRDPSPWQDAKSLMSWFNLLRRIKPDAVLLGTPKASLVGLVAAKFARVPVRTYLLRGLRLETTHGLLRRILWLFERAAISTSTDVISTSPSLLDRARELNLTGGTPILVLGSGSSHGIDLSRFNLDSVGLESRSATRSLLDLTSADFVVGYVGRIRADKGVPELIDAVDLMNRSEPVKLVLLGRVEEEQVLELASSAIAAKQIVHLHHVEDIEKYIPAFDILCLPSHREGFPNVVIEAAALNVPSVVSDATGVCDAVTDNLTGKTFKVRDTQDLVAALEVMRDARTRKRFARNAFQRVAEEFDDRRVNDLFLKHMTTKVRGHLPTKVPG